MGFLWSLDFVAPKKVCELRPRPAGRPDSGSNSTAVTPDKRGGLDRWMQYHLRLVIFQRWCVLQRQLAGIVARACFFAARAAYFFAAYFFIDNIRSICCV
jgi:hypothetical protein